MNRISQWYSGLRRGTKIAIAGLGIVVALAVIAVVAVLFGVVSTLTDPPGSDLREEAGDAVALDFINALEDGIEQITRSPNSGSLRFAYELAIPDLRAWGLRRFPYVVFYTNDPDAVRVHRVLHSSRDIPAELSGP